MSNNFEKFFTESTRLQQTMLTEQIRISEDVNKYSIWFLGLSTVGIGLLITQFDSILTKSWVGADYIKTYLIIVGALLFISIAIGVLVHQISIKERNCYRILITLFGTQGITPFFNLPELPQDEIPDDLDLQIKNGGFLGIEKKRMFENAQSSAKRLRNHRSTLLAAQQIFAGVSYALFFALSITK